MGNISWRGQGSSEDTDSSLPGDLDEDTGKDMQIYTGLLLVQSRLWELSGLERFSLKGSIFCILFGYLTDKHNEETGYWLFMMKLLVFLQNSNSTEPNQFRKTDIKFNVNEQARTQTVFTGLSLTRMVTGVACYRSFMHTMNLFNSFFWEGGGGNKCMLALFFLEGKRTSLFKAVVGAVASFGALMQNQLAGRMKCRGHSSVCFLCRVALWKVLIFSAEVLGGPSPRRLRCRATAFHHRLPLCLVTSTVCRQKP